MRAIDPSKPLKNQRREAFAKLIAKGSTGEEAYRKVYGYGGSSARANACRLLTNESETAQRVKFLKTSSASAHCLTMQERRMWLARTVRSDISKFDPETDGDLIEEIIEEKGKKRYRFAGKRACIMDDARLAGELIDKSDLTSDGEALPSMMPTIELRMPQSFVNRRTGRN